MKKLFFILLLLSSISVFAKTKTFIREYTYQASDYDSKVTARVNALEEVKRLLLEEVAVFIKSEFEDRQWEKQIGDKIESGEFTEKRLISITAGITQTEILEEKWTGVEYWLKARITIDPDEMKKQLDLILQDKEKTKELEKMRQMADEARGEIERLRHELESVKNEKEQIVLQNEYKKNVDQLDAIDWYNKGYDADLKKEYDKAKSFYLRAIELNPDFSDAYNNLGLVYDKQENYSDAIKCYNKAIEINPNYSYPYNNLGNVYSDQGNDYDAIKYYMKAIELNPNNSYLYNNLGLVYDNQENYADAIKCYNKAIEINPDFSNAYYNLGVVYGKQGNYDDEINSYKKAIELNPELSVAYLNLGVVYYDQGNYVDAIKCFQKSAKLGNIDAQKFLRDSGQEW
ncbi:MAG: tetratricopeptide repeat protein [Candidatus Marinimicrobia bacterium]|nr:tetratricopeptide repeat protein [Candidatus Neomarinimicrobiota bacterium]